MLAPVSEEVPEPLESEDLLDGDDEDMPEKADSEMIDEDALLAEEPAKVMDVDETKEEVRKRINHVLASDYVDFSSNIWFV